jgi:hypothetical protein
VLGVRRAPRQKGAGEGRANRFAAVDGLPAERRVLSTVPGITALVALGARPNDTNRRRNAQQSIQPTFLEDYKMKKLLAVLVAAMFAAGVTGVAFAEDAKKDEKKVEAKKEEKKEVKKEEKKEEKKEMKKEEAKK